MTDADLRLLRALERIGEGVNRLAWWVLALVVSVLALVGVLVTPR